MSEIGVGLVGYKFLGKAHSNAYRQVARFFDADPAPRMVALCGRDEAAVSQAASALGWEGYETDYHRLLERDDIQLVDISSSGDTHHEFAVAALEAGKHPAPSFEDGYRSQAVLDAVEWSVESWKWTTPEIYEPKED